MYKHAYQILVALTLFAVVMVPATQAQSIMLKADIPFDFVVGKTRLPAGEYHVKPVNQAVTLIQSRDARASAIAMTTAVQAKKTADVGKLVFNRYGDQYFLSKIWSAASDTGRELPKSSLEREVAQGVSKATTLVIAAKTEN